MSTRYGLSKNQTVGAVVLAGGLARRMGGIDKGLVQIAGRAMAQYTLQTLQPLFDELIINANRNLDVYREMGYDVVEDNLADHQGPLAGLSAAISVLNSDYIFMCPCDSPFLESGLVEKIVTQCVLESAEIAVAHDGERLQPVFCAVHRGVHSSLDAFLQRGERKIDRWFAEHKVTHVDAKQFSGSFRNINTEEERINAENWILK